MEGGRPPLWPCQENEAIIKGLYQDKARLGRQKWQLDQVPSAGR